MSTKWKLRVYGITLVIPVEEVPNWFWRKVQRVLLRYEWSKIDG